MCGNLVHSSDESEDVWWVDGWIGRHVCKGLNICLGRLLASNKGTNTCPGLLYFESCLCLCRALAQSSEDKGMEQLETKPAKRSPSLEPGSFRLPPLSLVGLGSWGLEVLL